MQTPPTSRRSLLAGLGLLGASARTGLRPPTYPEIVRPKRLQPDDRVGMVSPASAAWDRDDIDVMREALEALGLRVELGPNFFARRGYFAGTDEQRAADIMGFVKDPGVRGIWARGGWGSARVLPLLDFDAIRANPKVFVGYSDATALLSGVHRRTGLVTFHGPFPSHRYSADVQRAILMDADAVTLTNPIETDSNRTVPTADRVRTLTPGKARGRLVGGNLTVLSAIVGTPYFPDLDGAILFLEDINEAVYRVDRMLTQLRLAGALDGLAGFVFGHCTDCSPNSGHGSLTLLEVLEDHIVPLGIPAYSGALIGHIPRQFTLPIGIDAEIDAGAGSLSLLSAAVT